MNKLKALQLTVLLVTTLLLLVATPLYPQSDNQNYIVNQTYTSTTAHNDVIQYYDGLGRPIQTVRKQFTPGGNDLVARIEYDSFGRQSKTWLPAPNSNSNGAFDGSTNVASSYGNDTCAFSETKYESSPLNRVDEQYGPGQAWRSNSRRVKTEFLANTTSGDLVCPFYYLQDPYTLRKKDNYAAGQLFVTKTTDEDNNISYEFRDKLGRVLLQRRMDGSLKHDVNYVYDDFGNLAVVLPPIVSDGLTADNTNFNVWGSGTANDLLTNYGYWYHYDGRNRQVSKFIARVGEDFIYDKADRPVFRRTAENEYLFTKYDALGRVILSGQYTGAHQDCDWLRTHFSDLVSKEQTASNQGNYYYTWNTFPSASEVEVTQVNYYDDYTNFTNGDAALNYTIKEGYDAQHASAKGLLTGTRTRLLGGNSWINTAYYYDYKGNLVQKCSSNLLGEHDYEYYAYNYNNQVSKKFIAHSTSSQALVTEEYIYSYDSQLRLTSVTHNLNNTGAVTIAGYTYNNLGQVQTLTTGNLTTATYAYNIRGWEESQTGNKFEEKLYYTSNHPTGGQLYFGGNIAAQTWKNPTVNATVRGYAFQYDGLERLKTAGYGEGTSLNTNTQRYGESFTYDKHGNPLTIKRYGRKDNNTFDLIDDLTMPQSSYLGNWIREVNDAAGDQNSSDLMEFKNGMNNSDGEYVYNSSGGLVADYNKKVCQIRYNYLLLPQSVQFRYGHRIEYTYDASGMKHAVKYREANQDMNYGAYDTSVPADNNFLPSPLTKNYIGNKVYENSQLKLILTENGYIEKSGNTYNRYYYLKDHLGNNRIVMNSSGTPVQITNYYPSGTTMAEYPARTDQGVQAYKYNGKELDRSKGLDFYDYEARQYDPVLMRFTAPDPLAEKYYSVSPYAYCANNPINAIDPTGMDYTYNWDTKNYEDDEGHVVQWSTVLDWLKNLFTINIDPQNLEKSKKEQEKKIETLQQMGDGLNSLNSTLLAFNPFGSLIELGANLSAGNSAGAWASVPWLLVDAATAGEGKALKSGIKFLNAEQLAKKLGTTVADYHQSIKTIMKKDFAKEMKAIGTTNPDFSPNEAGFIVLRNPQTGKTIVTNVPLSAYKK
ncbi:hypothetical protein FACS189446_1990 [Bacteroidia bacterium]|nr:hypothetical protein FACS189446_1990 [Bacteroidia bacterium]